MYYLPDRYAKMKKISPTTGIVLIFVGFCVLAILSFLFGLVLASNLIPLYILYSVIVLGWGCSVFFALMKHVRTSHEEGKTIGWYKEGNLMLIFAQGLALLLILTEQLIPDQNHIVLKDVIAILIAVFFIGLVIYAFILLLRRH